MPNTHHPLDILKFARERISANIPWAWVIVTDISGGTLRAKGAMMAVTNDQARGYISAGCVDGDIIAQARRALTDGRDRSLRYGEGSPFKDIALPCGGAINVKIIPNPPFEKIENLYAALSDRTAARLEIDGQAINYAPKLKLRLVGRGAPLYALAELATGGDNDIRIESPDPLPEGLTISDYHHLTDPADPPICEDDPWTAVVVLFHDHDWEPHILKSALSGPAFYIGAMGSERTHALRIKTLKALNIPKADIERIHAPVGLIPAMRDANLLAVSILAEIIRVAQEQGRL